MKILKRGTLPSETPYQVTCKICGTIFEFIRSEAEFNSDQRDGDYLKIRCPVCNEPCYTQANKPKKPKRIERW